MFSGKKFILLCMPVAVMISFQLAAQNLKGKVIYVSHSQEVMVKFPSVITNYNFVNKEAANLFETRITNNKNFSINSTLPNFKTTNLIITEGSNSHLFIIEYKEVLDAKTESLYDYSRKIDLRSEANNLARSGATTAPAVSSGDQRVADPPAATPTANRPVSNKPSPRESNDSFSELQTRANKAYIDEKYDEAKDLYTRALALKPNEDWPTRQLAKIEEKKNALVKMEEQKRQEAMYQRHKSIADSAYFKKAYDIAKVEYVQALRIKTTDRYAASQIVKIDNVLKEEAYKNYMKSGRAAYSNKLYNEAETAFNEALRARPFDGEAKKELARTAAAKVALEKKEKEQQFNNVKLAGYNDTIRTADNMFQSGLYLEARKSYKNADKIKPGEPYTSRRIKQIDSILQVEKSRALQSQKDIANAAKYDHAIEAGNKAFDAKEYKKAKASYQQAIALNASEKYPLERISVIDVMLKDEEQQKNAALTQKQQAAKDEKQYASYVRQGNAALGKKRYEEAKHFFMQAMQLKPFEKLPMTQLDIINKKLDEISINARYEHFIHLADSIAFTAKDPEASLKFYDSARILKPQEAYPKKQIQAHNSNLMITASRQLELQQQKERTLIFNQYFPEYKKADDARMQGKYPEAYTGFSGFLARLDTANADKYLSSQLFYIKQAMNYVTRLEAYKPKPVIEPVKAETQNEKKKKRNRKNS